MILYKQTLAMYMHGGCMNNVGYKPERWTQKLKSHHYRFVQQRMAVGWTRWLALLPTLSIVSVVIILFSFMSIVISILSLLLLSCVLPDGYTDENQPNGLRDCHQGFGDYYAGNRIDDEP